MINQNVSFTFVLVVIYFGSPMLSNACDELFEGFGIHLGSINHFASSPPGMVSQVFDTIYNDLKIRHFRTSFESSFSPIRDVYEIVCSPNASAICSWIEVHNKIAQYRNTSVIASIWSPPAYMKNQRLDTLPFYEEDNYYYFIKNVTELIKIQFNITIERISPINEPENIFAPWEHTNMLPQQLCRMVSNFNDPLISICPENAYFSTSLSYSSAFGIFAPTCLQSCKIIGTHAYALNIGGENNLKAYYDLVSQSRRIPNSIPIWQTEVSSTYDNAENNQMRESLDMAINIANFVGRTCIQRYYFWLSYTLNPSGESLIWGNSNGTLTFPKKYYSYRHFTRASFRGSKIVNRYIPVRGVSYLTFGDCKVVFVNNVSSTVVATWTDDVNCVSGTFCCTTDPDDWNCSGNGSILPAESVCSCDYKMIII